MTQLILISTICAFALLAAINALNLIAVLQSVLTGRSVYATALGHLHQRLLDRFSHPTMLLVVAVLCSTTTLSAILSVHFGQQFFAVGGVAMVLGALVLTRSFGDAELRMLASRTSHTGESLLARSSLCETAPRQHSLQLPGNHCWDAIWTSFVEFASDGGLARIKRLMKSGNRLPEMVHTAETTLAASGTTSENELQVVDSRLSQPRLAFFAPRHEANV